MNSKAIELKCPKCDIPIPAYKVNVSANVAECTVCDSRFELEELLKGVEVNKVSKEGLALPVGSDIEVSEQGGSVSIHVPRRRFGGEELITLLFTFFWVGGVVKMIVDNDTNVLFKLITYFFLLVPISMWYSALKDISYKESILLKGNELLLSKRNLFNKKTKVYDLNEIIELRLVQTRHIEKRRPFFSVNAPIHKIQYNMANGLMETPTVLSAKGAYFFFLSADELEQKWVVRYLNYHIEKLGGAQ